MTLRWCIAATLTTLLYGCTHDIEDASHPETIAGCWIEEGAGGTDLDKIGELYFRDNGTFVLTWQPFEFNADYLGNYTYNNISGSISLTITAASHIHPSLDLNGIIFTNNNGDLIFTNMYLGNSISSTNDSDASRNYIFNDNTIGCRPYS